MVRVRQILATFPAAQSTNNRISAIGTDSSSVRLGQACQTIELWWMDGPPPDLAARCEQAIMEGNMTNEEFAEIWIGYGCTKKGPIICEGGTIYGFMGGRWIPFCGTNVNSGARFSMMDYYTSKVWLMGHYNTIPISTQLRKILEKQCTFRCGSQWANTKTLDSFYAQQWMRGYWAMMAELNETGTELLIPAPCYAKKVGHYTNKPKLVLPPTSGWWSGNNEMTFEGYSKESFVSPDADWPFKVGALSKSQVAGSVHITLTRLTYQLRMYNNMAMLSVAKSECNKYYKSQLG